MTAEQIRYARDLLTRPDNTVSSIARLLGVSRATIYKYVPEVTTGRVAPPCRRGRSSGPGHQAPRRDADRRAAPLFSGVNSAARATGLARFSGLMPGVCS